MIYAIMVTLDRQCLSWPACYGAFAHCSNLKWSWEQTEIMCQGGSLLKGRAVAAWGRRGCWNSATGKVRQVVLWGLEEGLRSVCVFLKNWCFNIFFFCSVGIFTAVFFSPHGSEQEIRSKNKLWTENRKKETISLCRHTFQKKKWICYQNQVTNIFKTKTIINNLFP